MVCSFSGSRTIGECLQAVSKLRYPAFKVIVVDDGSEDETAAIAAQYDVDALAYAKPRIKPCPKCRMAGGKGEIVAYIDDDAYPDRTGSLTSPRRSGVVTMPEWGPISRHRTMDPSLHAWLGPRGPQHVLLTDTEAEHIPGCNMAFLRSALEAVGGFDDAVRVAGDDVDMCWRLQERGWKLGFSPSAQVWHRRRNSLRAYWRQQTGYGKAEALLEKKWPKKYNSVGHLTWRGRVYGPGRTGILRTATRIYYGQWGSAPFQSLYETGSGYYQSVLLMPEWYLANLSLALLSVLGIHWRPLLLALPLLAVSAGTPIVNAWAAAARSRFQSPGSHFRLKLLTAYLHMLQPAARLHGRLRHGLKFWRSRVPAGFVIPMQKKLAVWTERREAPKQG